MAAAEPFSWLTRTGQSWKLRAEVWVGLLTFAIMLLSFLILLAAFFAGPRLLRVACGAWAVCLGLRLGAQAVKYHGIRCPRCGHRPTRGSDGKWLPEDVLHDRLAALEACPSCGDSGRSAEPEAAPDPAPDAAPPLSQVVRRRRRGRPPWR